MSDYPEVELSKWEIVHAGNGGMLRQVTALENRLHDPDAHHRDPMEAHVSGAIAEYAVSLHLGIPWHPQVGIRWAGEVDGDVGKIEVRSTHLPHGGRILHPYSFDDRPYVLVLSYRAPIYVPRGWVWGREGKRNWRNDLPRPGYLNKPGWLHPMETLPVQAVLA